MNVSSRQLKAFVLVARLKNFTRAAEKMHMTQAGLSVMMRELEAQIGARLFDRTPRLVTLTDSGESLFPVALRVSEEIDDIWAKINTIGENARSVLRVAATPMVAANLLPAVCNNFRDSHPNVHISVVDCDLSQVHRLVDNGDVDMGIGFFSKAFHGIDRTLLHTSRLMRVDAFPEAKVGIACESSDQVQDECAPWSSLGTGTLLGLPPTNPIQKMVDAQLSHIDCSAMERQWLNHFETLIAMVASGAGATVIPSLAMLACRRYPVRFKMMVDPVVELGLYRITKMGREKYPAMVDFSDALMSTLSLLMSDVPR